MPFTFLSSDRRFRPAGLIGNSYFPNMVWGSDEGNSFIGYNNAGVTVDDGRSEYGYHQRYRQPRRGGQRPVYVPRPVVPRAWSSRPWWRSWSNDLTPIEYLRLFGLSCEQWLARTLEQKYWTVQIGLQASEPSRINGIINVIDRYCTPWPYQGWPYSR